MLLYVCCHVDYCEFISLFDASVEQKTEYLSHVQSTKIRN